MRRIALISLFVLTLSSVAIAQSSNQDGNNHINLMLTDNRITVNGETIIEIRGKCGSQMLAFHDPQRGWFVLSTKSEEGYDFQKVGQLIGNRITFTLNNDIYEWINKDPIGANSESADIWVLHIPPSSGEREGGEKGKQISCFTGLKYFLEQNVYAKKKGA